MSHLHLTIKNAANHKVVIDVALDDVSFIKRLDGKTTLYFSTGVNLDFECDDDGHRHIVEAWKKTRWPKAGGE